jgi:hypothetical protein
LLASSDLPHSSIPQKNDAAIFVPPVNTPFPWSLSLGVASGLKGVILQTKPVLVWHLSCSIVQQNKKTKRKHSVDFHNLEVSLFNKQFALRKKKT